MSTAALARVRPAVSGALERRKRLGCECTWAAYRTRRRDGHADMSMLTCSQISLTCRFEMNQAEVCLSLRFVGIKFLPESADRERDAEMVWCVVLVVQVRSLVSSFAEVLFLTCQHGVTDVADWVVFAHHGPRHGPLQGTYQHSS